MISSENEELAAEVVAIILIICRSETEGFNENGSRTHCKMAKKKCIHTVLKKNIEFDNNTMIWIQKEDMIDKGTYF